VKSPNFIFGLAMAFSRG